MIVTACPQENSLGTGLTAGRDGQESLGREPPLPPAGPETNVERQMVMWPALTLLGFLVLTALVIAMGTQSTARYEAEKRAASAPRSRTSAPEAARAAVAATAVL
jgi:hypothetical protein